MPALHRLSSSLPPLVMTPFVPVAAAYADEGSPAESSDIYVGDNYDENYDISLF